MKEKLLMIYMFVYMFRSDQLLIYILFTLAFLLAYDTFSLNACCYVWESAAYLAASMCIVCMHLADAFRQSNFQFAYNAACCFT